ncbi:hypothetical protein MRB53_036060 [Persea americana]|uniref:Uncharacterized protein n=1 Tax=Persea americana TaxID=3435 RepID=A0ACC2K6D8_PERAE|nr:hypothetical protein MRB53_036060 [Persea americana]
MPNPTALLRSSANGGPQKQPHQSSIKSGIRETPAKFVRIAPKDSIFLVDLSLFSDPVQRDLSVKPRI